MTTTAAVATNPRTRSSFSFTIFYNDVNEVPLPPNHRFPMSKYRQTRELLQKMIAQTETGRQEVETSNPDVSSFDCQFVVSPLATVQELETTHCASYIQRYLAGKTTEKEYRNVGFPWSPQGVEQSLSSVGGTLAAACTVVEQSCVAHTANNGHCGFHWGAHVAGGTHHAFYNRGEGFSVFSDMAVAANVVLQRNPTFVKRILFLDLDTHQGNGNAVLFRDNPHVFTFSMHCKANYFSKKETSDLDIELPAGCNDSTFLMTLQHWLNRFRRGDAGEPSFDLVMFQAGVDVLEEDRLGRMDLTATGLARRNEMVYDFCRDLQLPLVICMGGGYHQKRDQATIIQAHANVYYQAYKYLEQLHEQQVKGTVPGTIL